VSFRVFKTAFGHDLLLWNYELDIPGGPPPLELCTVTTWPSGIMNAGIRAALPSLKFMNDIYRDLA
jgi:hypothetical protein